MHSNGGELTPHQLAAAARAAGLDFIVGTEHNTAAAHEIWHALTSDDLLVLLGQEVVTREGHWLALGLTPGQVIGWDYDADDKAPTPSSANSPRSIASAGCRVAAHPFAPYPTGTFLHPYQDFDAFEVWNGPWTSEVPWQADNEAALAEWARSLAADVPKADGARRSATATPTSTARSPSRTPSWPPTGADGRRPVRRYPRRPKLDSGVG